MCDKNTPGIPDFNATTTTRSDWVIDHERYVISTPRSINMNLKVPALVGSFRPHQFPFADRPWWTERSREAVTETEKEIDRQR